MYKNLMVNVVGIIFICYGCRTLIGSCDMGAISLGTTDTDLVMFREDHRPQEICDSEDFELILCGCDRQRCSKAAEQVTDLL